MKIPNTNFIPAATYCHSCGTKLTAGARFCQSCGVSLASLSEKPKPIIHKEATVVAVGIDEDGDETNYLDRIAHYTPQIESLAVEIEKPRLANKETFKDLATNPFVNVATEQRQAPPTLSAEETLKQFQHEAGAIRP